MMKCNAYKTMVYWSMIYLMQYNAYKTMIYWLILMIQWGEFVKYQYVRIWIQLFEFSADISRFV